MTIDTANRNRTANLRPFQPGQSGNPRGRPVGVEKIIRRQTKNGREIIDFMVAVMRGTDPFGHRTPPWKQRLEAAVWLGDRLFGKAPVTVDDLPPGVGSLTIREIVVERSARAGDEAD